MKKVNLIALIADMVIAGSAFLPYYSEGLARIGAGRTYTLFEIGSGKILLILAILILLFIIIRKKTPIVVGSVLLVILEVIQIIITTSDIAYMTSFSFQYGFYILLIAVLLLLFSEPVNNALIKKLHLNDKILTEAQQK